MKLKEYLKEKNIKQEEFAKQIETAQGCVSRWCGGEIPRADMMTKILIATKGKVTANDFYYGDNNG